MPKNPNGEGLSESTVDNIKGALDKGFQIFRSLQGYHTCTIIRFVGYSGGNPMMGFAPSKSFNSVYQVEVEISEFSVEEMVASGGMIKSADKNFEFRTSVKIGDVIAVFGVLPIDTIDDGGTPRAPDFNNITDCEAINKPELHGIGIEDDPINNDMVQYYRLYKVDEDDRMGEWIGYGRLVRTPLQDGSSPEGDEHY